MNTNTFRPLAPDDLFEVANSGHADREEGERLKQLALDALSRSRSFHILRGRRALLGRLLDAGTGTADHVRKAIELPDGISPTCLGAVPGLLAKRGIIRSAGFVNSTRKESHARPTRVWELVDREAALQWLRDHPEPVIERAVQRELFEEGGAP